MCGIAGAIGRLDAQIDSAVRSMSDAQRHRGPDGDGFWRSNGSAEETGVVFAHRRLAIIDLREVSNQPMVDGASANVVVFNGEIYNYRELRAELEAEGCTFKTDGDTEVLLKAYHVWGRECIARLRGMFAFALWDSVRDTTLMVRDRMGIKPFYYATVNHDGCSQLLFASEVRALLASQRVPRVLDDHSVQSYLWHGFVPGPRTIVADIRLLEAGHLMEVDSRGNIVLQQRYWSAPLNSKQGVSDDSNKSGQDVDVERARAELNEAIRLRLRSDVPVGVFLSGGVDSSVVTHGSMKASPDAISTFTIGFDEAGFDESEQSADYAKEIGVDNTVRSISQQDFVDLLPTALSNMDQPTYDGINSYLISSVVRDHGIKVALSGTGGDELFGGYESFSNLYNAHRFGRFTSWMPAALLNGAIRTAQRIKNPQGMELRKFLDNNKTVASLQHGSDTVAAYQALYGIFAGELITRLHQFDADESMTYGLETEKLNQWRATVAGLPVESATGFLESSSFLTERVLRDADAASMAVSLELRVPLIDHVFVEALGRFPASQRYQPFGKKNLLKQIGLPEHQWARFDRPKSGFTIPISEWIGDALGARIRETLGDKELARKLRLSSSTIQELVDFNTHENRQLLWPRIWSVFVLMNWCQMHGLSSR
ncbi:MAG: asparagine synthase (glutamine-hydrolyzing) [Granulosicoccus sp.]|nr:asparagine synthase (glutamine-hydrolyzing) [Granulosicoccus sp.]